ncbi:MAG TPA: LPXTG cell wall anchor domain-containing protein [Microlunatus sp.]
MTITYSVTVDDPGDGDGDGVLLNVVTSDSVGATCKNQDPALCKTVGGISDKPTAGERPQSLPNLGGPDALLLVLGSVLILLGSGLVWRRRRRARPSTR